MKFYHIDVSGQCHIVIYEPYDSVHVWLLLHVFEELRGIGVPARVVPKVIRTLGGTHELHIPRWTFELHRIAFENGWQCTGDSNWFNDCIAYRTVSKTRRAPTTGFMITVDHEIPQIDNIGKGDLAWVLRAIDRDHST